MSYLQPEFTIPFASFIYFCNKENSWLNQFAITPQRVMDMGVPGMNFMYPGDEWDSNVRSFRSAEAVSRYMADAARPKAIDPTPPSVDVKNVESAANRMLRIVRARFGKFLIGRIKPFSIYIYDQDKILLVNPAGICEVLDADGDSRQKARFVICSQVAWYAFAYTWGWAAMEVSSMYLDRRWQEPCPIAFYLNALSTEFLDFRGLQQSLRTLQFLWGKRYEVVARILERVFSGREQKDGFVSRPWLSNAAVSH